jgi:hypothetical protein
MKKFMVAMLAVVALMAFAGAAFASESPSSRVIIKGRMLTDIGYWNKSKELTTNQNDDVTTAFVNV